MISSECLEAMGHHRRVNANFQMTGMDLVYQEKALNVKFEDLSHLSIQDRHT